MKKNAIVFLASLLLLAPSLCAQTTPDPIPEEARKHFIMGTTLFKDAKTPEDYAQVESQFKQAVDLAPQWPDPRYNLALTKEAAGDYAGAMADLKVYLQFKLSDTEARTAQDKIYTLEAKQQKIVDAANSPAAQLEKLIKSLDGGVWRMSKSTASMDGGAWHTEFDRSNRGENPSDYFLEIHGHEISGWSTWNNPASQLLQMNPQMQNVRLDSFKTTFKDTQFNVDPKLFLPESVSYYKVTISPDGQSISVEKAGGHFQAQKVYQRIQ